MEEYSAETESAVYFKCTSCSECFMTEEVFFAHSRTWHCKILLNSGQCTEVTEQRSVLNAGNVLCVTESNSNSMQDFLPKGITIGKESGTLVFEEKHNHLDPHSLSVGNERLSELKSEDSSVSKHNCTNLLHSEVCNGSANDFCSKNSSKSKNGDEFQFRNSFVTYLPGNGMSNFLANDDSSELPSVSSSERLLDLPVSGMTSSFVYQAQPIEAITNCKSKQQSKVKRSADKQKIGHLKSINATGKLEPFYLCRWCQKPFPSLYRHRRHEQIHTGFKPYKCQVCSKSFLQSSDLKRHMRSHTHEKPYQCMACQKRYAQAGDLSRHMRIHSGVKLFNCRYCQKPFTLFDTCLLHEKSCSRSLQESQNTKVT